MTPREPLWADMVSSLTLFMIGGLVLAFVLAGRLDLTAYLLAHVGCAAAAFLLALSQRPRPRRQTLLLALATTSMGPAGAAGVFICTIFEMCFRPYATPFTEWFASIFPEEGDKSRQGFLDLLHSSEDPVTTSLRISSFRDTISTGTIEQKAGTARTYRPALLTSFRPRPPPSPGRPGSGREGSGRRCRRRHRRTLRRANIRTPGQIRSPRGDGGRSLRACPSL
jgi:hypothetical protein